MVEFSTRTVDVAGVTLTLLEAGKGPPLLVLHEELGPTEPRTWHKELAKHHRLVIPIQPGFRSPRAKWIRSARDVAVLYGCLLRQEGLIGCDAIGFSFGGWVAAEMAVNNPANFRSLTLVAPFGVKPDTGVIKDMFPISSYDYLLSSVTDPAKTPEFAELYGPDRPEQIEVWEDARTECARLGWEPYMHNKSLPNLLETLGGLPSLIIWGSKDAILPRDAVEIYARNIPNARLKVIDGVGHRPEIESSAAFLAAIVPHLKSLVSA